MHTMSGNFFLGISPPQSPPFAAISSSESTRAVRSSGVIAASDASAICSDCASFKTFALNPAMLRTPDSLKILYLRIISDESRRLSRLVRRMLDVSQLQAIDPLREGKHFDICESMRRVLISMERKITDRNLDVEADIPEEPILVLGDKDMITQVIYNLLENATKFAREGSTLYLGVTTIDGKARVTVRNEGDTIPAEELPLLFERFHKSDKSRSEDKDGYGLGLYIVKTILEQHKEKISVTSEDGVTAFSFSLATE